MQVANPRCGCQPASTSRSARLGTRRPIGLRCRIDRPPVAPDADQHPAALPGLIEKIVSTGKPVVFEEDLEFTRTFVEMFPDMTIIIPHLGLLGGYPLDFLKAFKKNENVYFDTALGSRDMIFEFIRTIGPERVLYGSDVPFGTMRSELAKVTSLSLSHKEKELVLSGNVTRLARLAL